MIPDDDQEITMDGIREQLADGSGLDIRFRNREWLCRIDKRHILMDKRKESPYSSAGSGTKRVLADSPKPFSQVSDHGLSRMICLLIDQCCCQSRTFPLGIAVLEKVHITCALFQSRKTEKGDEDVQGRCTYDPVKP